MGTFTNTVYLGWDILDDNPDRPLSNTASEMEGKEKQLASSELMKVEGGRNLELGVYR